MTEKIKGAFDPIRADSSLKNETMDYIAQKLRKRESKHIRVLRQIIPALACLVLLAGIGFWQFFAPSSVISVDINLSIELTVNRFGRIISATGWDEEGEALAAEVNVVYMDYSDGVEDILESKRVRDYLSQGEIVSVSVIASGDSGEKMLNNLCCYAGEGESLYYSYMDYADVKDAHSLGLSYGKYKAYLEAKAVSLDITVSEVKKMTMSEIWSLVKGADIDKPLPDSISEPEITTSVGDTQPPDTLDTVGETVSEEHHSEQHHEEEHH